MKKMLLDNYFEGLVTTEELLYHDEPEYFNAADIESNVLEQYIDGALSLETLIKLEEIWLQFPHLQDIYTTAESLQWSQARKKRYCAKGRHLHRSIYGRFKFCQNCISERRLRQWLYRKQ